MGSLSRCHIFIQETFIQFTVLQYKLFLNPPPKDTWKSMLNSKINSYLETRWEQEILCKKSLKYLNPKSVVVGIPHMYMLVKCAV